MRVLNGAVVVVVVCLAGLVAGATTIGATPIVNASVVEAGSGASLPQLDLVEDAGRVLEATAGVIRTVSPEDAEVFGALAAASPELSAARLRLSPLSIDATRPRLVGSTIGLVGVYYPIRGAVDGLASQYALWFDSSTNDVWAEAEFVHRTADLRVRMVVLGEEVMNTVIDGEGAPGGGNFWECFRWCLGESLSSEVYAIFRAVCGRLCFPFPSFFCDKCMIALGLLEAGMVSGCTHECLKNP